MPNWTTNWVTIKGNKEKIKEVLGDRFDFNKLIPMPKTLHITSGSITKDAISYYETDVLPEGYSWCKDLSDEPESKDLSYLWTPIDGICERPKSKADFKALGRIALENEKQYGFRDWYDWACKNWGTKWGACDIEVEETDDGFSYNFDTAWAMPFPIFEKVCELLETCEIFWEWVDEEDLYDEDADDKKWIEYKNCEVTDYMGSSVDVREV